MDFINFEITKLNFQYFTKLLDKIKSLEIKINKLQNEVKTKDNIINLLENKIKNLENYKEKEILFNRTYK